MLLTTTGTVEGHKIKDYLGIVTGEAIMGANVVRDFLASVTDIVGGRSGAYEQKLAQARNIAIREMQDEARRLNANGIIGIDIDYEVVRDGMLMVSVSGTAVYLE
ncbi:MAG: YbjQ family protein [Clostridia bacterium]|nr:YbjQ family protein [Clostridia bacterium]